MTFSCERQGLAHSARYFSERCERNRDTAASSLPSKAMQRIVFFGR